MYLTKLSSKYHKLNKERKVLEQINENTNDDSDNGKSVPASPLPKHTDLSKSGSSNPPVRSNLENNRPNPEVIVISTSSSESESASSSILNEVGKHRNIDSTMPPTCTRTSCAGWKRLESTHIDHLDETGHRNISLFTDDLSAIQEADNSTSFVTAATHFTPSTQPPSEDKRRSNFGANLNVLNNNASSSLRYFGSDQICVSKLSFIQYL